MPQEALRIITIGGYYTHFTDENNEVHMLYQLRFWATSPETNLAYLGETGFTGTPWGETGRLLRQHLKDGENGLKLMQAAVGPAVQWSSEKMSYALLLGRLHIVGLVGFPPPRTWF